jgi:quinol monooxygenase YgiN
MLRRKQRRQAHGAWSAIRKAAIRAAKSSLRNWLYGFAPEHAIKTITHRGVRATAVRLPRCVHGRGERHGFMPMLASVAREKGVSANVGDGENMWPSVHRLDAARVLCLAFENAAQDGAFHAVADQGIPFRQTAEAPGRQLAKDEEWHKMSEATSKRGPVIVNFVSFVVPPARLQDFMAMCVVNAEASRREEGVLVFDVLLKEQTANTVILMESYKDRAAYESHRTTPHFLAFVDGLKEVGAERMAVVARKVS